MRGLPAAMVLVMATLLAPAASADVALALTLPDKSPVHRDFAAGMVTEAYERFAMLQPQLTPEDAQTCQADDACLLRVAKERAASHLMLVGVASLGPSEYVVSLRILDVKTGADVVNVSDLASPGDDPHGAGRTLAGRAFAKAAGVPPLRASVASVEPAPAPALRRWDGTNPLSLVGWGVAALTTVGAGAAFLFGIPLFEQTGGAIESYSLGTALGVAGGYAVGFGLVATDAYVVNGE